VQDAVDMAFMLFKKERSGTGMCYSDAHQGYKLAGHNLLYKLWNKRNKPVECGWSVTADDLLEEHGEGFSSSDYALVIDFHPSAQNLIGLVEIDAIHVYTYGGGSGASWSPIMLELRDVYYDEDFDEPLTPNRKQDILARFELSPTRKKIIEFLYLQGGVWNWGKNGGTNAAFIHDDARRYFQRIFNTD
jgi:hypothetical protein